MYNEVVIDGICTGIYTDKFGNFHVCVRFTTAEPIVVGGESYEDTAHSAFDTFAEAQAFVDGVAVAADVCGCKNYETIDPSDVTNRG